ncbi:MAG: UDP-glucose 4-epimerase GalE [Candidatus Promineifilaceae bacterium]|nr:UDP-glucose 4-epimerase GalE [Candidatus Promineifilaceae bacterium]
MMRILLTGGAGYIGSHTAVELLNAGYEVVVVDNLANSCEESLVRVQELSGKALSYYHLDILDRAKLEEVFSREAIDAVIHFAALKAVAESVVQPLRYYYNNVTGTITLCQVMKEFGVKNLVFSSSATVYGENETVPLREDFDLLPATNPYGRSKQMMEDVLRDLNHADETWNIAILRYFNPIGAHESGRIGEDPNGIPANLLPYVAQVAIGKHSHVRVYGDDYPTPDGTGIRDYIHVVDLAVAHVKALKKLASNPGLVTYNLSTGKGSSVLQVIAAFEKACGKKIPYQIYPRRPGDLAVSYADPSKAEREICWVAERDLNDMCMDAWRWQSLNPNGFD